MCARIVCGPPESRPNCGADVLVLDNSVPDGNVHLKIEDVSKGLVEKVPPIFLDLIDISTYVYCADQAFRRNGRDALGEDWRRQLNFQIAVRRPDIWSSPGVMDDLVSTLSFLSEDEYSFEFSLLQEAPSAQRYFDFGQSPWGGHIDGVMLFSSGLDSLAGAIQESIVERRKVILVNHRSQEKLTPRYEILRQMLRDRAGPFSPVHIPVRINKDEHLTHEYTQRSRSFLCAALGATVASMVGLSKIRFYENGVVSLNLPPSPQVVGARATRTTHPRVLAGFESLFTRISGKPFKVENPFLWNTKTEVVRLIANNGCGPLIEHSFSCASTMRSSHEHSHCGECSQCIDRRFAVLAAEQEHNDPAAQYRIDLLTGARGEGLPRSMLAAYLETANRIRRMSELDFFSTFGEATRVLGYVQGGTRSTAAKIFDLHRRHADEVARVVARAIGQYGDQLFARQLPADCLLRLVLDTSVVQYSPPVDSGPENYVERAGKGWAIRFKGRKPKLYPDEVGFLYLQVLFANPGRVFSASELDARIRHKVVNFRMKVVNASDLQESQSAITPGTFGDDVLDPQTLEDYRNRLRAIDQLLPMLEAGVRLDRLEKIESLQQERTELRAALRHHQTPSGRPRQLGADRDKARTRVCNAIGRALKHIDEYDKPLREHLRGPTLKLGYTISYDPPEPRVWIVAADQVAAQS